jgi:uncharacterized membrane protein
MTDLIPRPSHLPDKAEASERNAALVIYSLYLAAPLSAGITGLIGALMASGRRKRAGPFSATHFKFQVWSFGAAAGAMLTGGFWGAVGGIASVSNRTGGDLAIAGGALAATAGIGFVAATVFGLTKAAGWDPIGPEDA